MALQARVDREVVPAIMASQEVTETVEQKALQVTGIDSKHLSFDFGGHDVRVIMKDEEPWFVAKDVCGGLGLQNTSKALQRLRDDEKGVTFSDTLGGKQMISTVSEPGLYKLIMRSYKPEAEKFVDWIAHEVIPTIRKTGAYMTDATLNKVEQDPEYMKEILGEIRTLKSERDEARAKGHRINDKRTATAMGRLGAQVKKVKLLETKVDYLTEDTLATRPMAVCEIDWIWKYFEHERPASLRSIIGRELSVTSRKLGYLLHLKESIITGHSVFGY